MCSANLLREVLRLAGEGLTDAAVSDLTGVPPTTVGRWRRMSNLPPRRRGPRPQPRRPLELDSPAYSYLLGLYLGDGCVSCETRMSFLRVSLDAVSPAIIEE